MIKFYSLVVVAFTLPWSATSSAGEVYKFNLAANSALAETCVKDSAPQRSKLVVSLAGQPGQPGQTGVPGQTAQYVSVLIKVKACTVAFGFRQVAISVNVPAVLLDPVALRALPSGSVIGDIPSTKTTGGINQVRVTKLAPRTQSPSTNVIPVTLEWLNSEYQPVEVEVSSSADAARTLPWTTLRLLYTNPLIKDPLVLAGQFDRVDTE